MARTVSQGFDAFLDGLIPTATQRAAAAAHRSSVEASIRKALTVSFFRETGSFHHGTGIRHHSDVDVLVSISGGRPGTSDTALGWVRHALQATFTSTPVYVSRPAVVVDFAGGDERWEVIPGFLKGRADRKIVYDIPGASSGWMESAPTEHLDYVNEANTVAGATGGAKKLSRLIKAWKYYCNVPVSSFYLEMRAAQHMKSQTSFIPIYDICYLLEKLDANGLAAMNDPKQVTERFHATSSLTKAIEAKSKVSTGATRARKALDAYAAGRHDEAFQYLDLLFGYRFPSR